MTKLAGQFFRRSGQFICAALIGVTCAFASSSPAFAQRTPIVTSLKTQCKMVGGQLITVVLNTKTVFIGSDGYEFKFTNAQGQAMKFYQRSDHFPDRSFPVPAGTYTLLVSGVNPYTKTVLNNTGQTLYLGIVVPSCTMQVPAKEKTTR
jgi:hypothetical protein